VVTVPPIADLAAAETLRQWLLDALAGCPEGEVVHLSAAGVDRISTACVQVILAARTSFAEAGRRLVLDQPSDVLTEAFDRLGLAADLPPQT
jgi:anti-anti-sigma regulatory factor